MVPEHPEIYFMVNSKRRKTFRNIGAVGVVRRDIESISLPASKIPEARMAGIT
jgi:hypothetical protein